MATNSSSSHQIPDITTCSICLELFKDPKVLPCIHTFCLQCLDKHCTNKNKEEGVSCPLCRKVFLIPPGGIEDLPDNFFIHQLLNVNKSFCNGGAQESVDPQPCELCSESGAEIPSTSFCVECDQHICDRCSVAHNRASVSKSHQVIKGTDLPSSQKRIKLAANYCDEHSCEENKLYCYECKVIMCSKCLSKHCQHNCSDVDEAGEIFRELLNDDIDILSTSINKQQTNLERLEFDTEKFLRTLASTESEISQKCDNLVSLIKSHKKELIKQICQFKDKILKEVETRKDEIERQFVITESFKRYCQEMRDKGTSCDISRTAHDLHARAEELVKTQDESDHHKLSEVEITFKPSLSTTNSARSLIGELFLGGKAVTMKDDDIQEEEINLTTFLTHHTLLQIMPSTRQYVTGITVLGSHIYVVRHTSHVFVYNYDDFTFIRNLKITGSKRLAGIVSCSHYNCLYAADEGQKYIFRHDLENKDTTTWSVRAENSGLSVTKCYNVLVVMYNRIREYTTNGILVKKIRLDIIKPERYRPWMSNHCVQLSTGNYVLCHEGTQHRVSIVNESGQIIHSYATSDEPQESGFGQLNIPNQLAVDMYDNVLVVDSRINRVQLLSPTLNYLGDVVIPEHEFKYPDVVHYDELNHRLYIGEKVGGRVFALRMS